MAGFVEGDPPVDGWAECFGYFFCIACEVFGEIGADHAAVVFFQPDGPDEVVEGEHGFHAVADDAIGDVFVVVDGGLVEVAAFGLDAGPGDGEAEEFDAEFGGGGDVVVVAVPEVGCFAARG